MNKEITPEQRKAINQLFPTHEGRGIGIDYEITDALADRRLGAIKLIEDINANPSKYGLSTPVTDEHLDALSIDLYEELFFMQIKVFTDVKKIVEKWWRKHSVTPVSDEPPVAGLAELRRKIYNLQQRIKELHSVTPVLSEQELLNGFCEFLKNDAQIYINGGTLTSYKLYNGKRLRGIELATEYLAALTANPKQHTEKSDI